MNQCHVVEYFAEVAQATVKDYPNVKVTKFSQGWSDGYAPVIPQSYHFLSFTLKFVLGLMILHIGQT